MPYYKNSENKVYFLDNAEFDTLLPPKCVAISDASAAALQQLPALTDAQQIIINEAAIDAVMEKIVTDKGYDSIASMLSKYASDVPVTGTDPVSLLREKWRLEANAFSSYPGTVWAQAYLYLETVTDKKNPMPTPAQAVAMMPVFVWPD